MNLHEEHVEHIQQKWHSHVERERRDLSVSVEETLLDVNSQEESEVDEVEISEQLAHDNALIPPRLSLQSRLMTALQPGCFVEAAKQEHSVTLQDAEGEQKIGAASPKAQNTPMLARVAQRITSSLAAFGTEIFLSGVSSVPGRSQGAARQQEQPLPVADMPASEVADAIAPVKSAVESVGPRPCLGGHTRKIRLETAVLPVLKPEQKAYAPWGESTTETFGALPAVGVAQAEEDISSAYQPELVERSGTTSAHLPTVIGRQIKGEAKSALHGAFFGSGVIESGQCDMIVANKHVIESSIVLVMLTNSPGPVVVQYISLQAQVGFTVHLTAPATMNASFNYVVLSGELY